MVKIAIILSGCGHLDGSEIRESILTLLAIDKIGGDVQIFAPDKDQYDVINHLTGEKQTETRNVLVEAARIARGDVQPLSNANADDFDALIISGGYGAAKNLSDIAINGANCKVDADFKALIVQFFTAKKPIGAICIAPAPLVAALSHLTKPKVTIGADANNLITTLGGIHHKCATDQCFIDNKNKIITTPAYMRDDAGLYEVSLGIERLVQTVINLANRR